MAQYSKKSDSAFSEKVLVPLLILRIAASQQTVPDSGENEQWFRFTECIQYGRIRPSIEQQYRQDLVRQGRGESIPGLRELYEEFKEIADLEDDWNAENAPAIDKQCLRRAHFFVGQLAGAEYDLTNQRNLPSVSPTVDGGVQLYWNIDNRQLAVTFRPNGNGIEYLLKKRGESAQRRSLMLNDAIAKVLQTMRDA